MLSYSISPVTVVAPGPKLLGTAVFPYDNVSKAGGGG